MSDPGQVRKHHLVGWGEVPVGAKYQWYATSGTAPWNTDARGPPVCILYVQCDRLAAEVYQCITPASNVTFFVTDFDFILGNERDGLRLYQVITNRLRATFATSARPPDFMRR